jgi:hypothetical protein
VVLNREKIIFLIAVVLCAYGIFDGLTRVYTVQEMPELPPVGSSPEPVPVTVPRPSFIADDFATLWGSEKASAVRDPFLKPEEILRFGAPTVPLSFPPPPPLMHLAPALSESPDAALVRPASYENPPKPVKE